MTWIYSQSTGELKRDGEHVAFGYSGFGPGKNDPQLQQVKDVGPIPQGFYTVEVVRGDQGEPVDYEEKKAPVMHLIPEPTNQMFGRDGFLMHGDSISEPGTASRGCVIMAHFVREQVAASADKDLQVTI